MKNILREPQLSNYITSFFKRGKYHFPLFIFTPYGIKHQKIRRYRPIGKAIKILIGKGGHCGIGIPQQHYRQTT